MRVWERVFRRAGVPLVYSQGFNPQPKLQIAAGLPLGYCSTSEVLDVWLEHDLTEPDATLDLLQDMSPAGLIVDAISPVDLRSPALQALTRRANYQVTLAHDQADQPMLETRVDAMMAQTEIVHERRGKTHDLRPLIEAIEVIAGDPLTLRMILTLSPQLGTGRPDEVLEVLGFDPLAAHVTRTAIEFEPA
jgi:radical SAM-linked protein